MSGGDHPGLDASLARVLWRARDRVAGGPRWGWCDGGEGGLSVPDNGFLGWLTRGRTLRGREGGEFGWIEVVLPQWLVVLVEGVLRGGTRRLSAIYIWVYISTSRHLQTLQGVVVPSPESTALYDVLIRCLPTYGYKGDISVSPNLQPSPQPPRPTSSTTHPLPQIRLHQQCRSP